MNIKKIKVIAKWVQSVEIEISAETGYDMPSSPGELIGLIDDIRDDFMGFVDANDWVTDSRSLSEISIDDFLAFVDASDWATESRNLSEISIDDKVI